MEQNLISQRNKEPCHGMGTELTTLASRRQFSHGFGLTMKLKVTHIFKEIGFLVVVGEVRCHVDETRMVWVTFDEGRED